MAWTAVTMRRVRKTSRKDSSRPDGSRVSSMVRVFQLPDLSQPLDALGWQVQPSFTVVQGESSRVALEEMMHFLGCGRVYRNRRHDNHREDLLRYHVYRFVDLRDVIVPFFSRNPLRTSKRDNFEKFAQVIDLMTLRRHLTVPWSHRDRGDRSDDELSKAIRSVENPQRPYADPLRGLERRG